jgi:hypothetical protein
MTVDGPITHWEGVVLLRNRFVVVLVLDLIVIGQRAPAVRQDISTKDIAGTVTTAKEQRTMPIASTSWKRAGIEEMVI